MVNIKYEIVQYKVHATNVGNLIIYTLNILKESDKI